jgi:hypothetical protein
MTAPAPQLVPLVPGPPRPIFTRYIKLTIDTNGTINSFECAVTQAGIVSTGGDKQELNTLCPDGSYSETTERTYSLDVTGVQDVETQDSFMLFLWTHAGEDAEAIFYPVADKNGTPQGYGWKGEVKLSPPDTIGNTTSGTYATFTASLPYQGKPVLIDSTGAEVSPAPVTPTGVTAGSPGAFTPANATAPANLAALQALGALGQSAAWTAGQYVVLGDGSYATWGGAAWAAATKATAGVAGTPGTWTPAGSIPPATLAALTGSSPAITATPATAWTTGQSVVLGNASDAHWSGTAWLAGVV